jgi:hypothetical protein
MSKNYYYLFKPKGYNNLTKEDKKRICNRCGPKSKFDFVPDTVYGLNIGEACNIHDYMYERGDPNIEAKKKADRIFLDNMLSIVNHETKESIGFGSFKIRNPLIWLRRKRVYKYYAAVKYFGGPAFWKNKK